MELRWKNYQTNAIGIVNICDDDGKILEMAGYKHLYNEYDEYDSREIEVWMPNNECFGIVKWNNEDLACALVDSGIDATQENVDKLRCICENNHHFTDGMIEAGWEMIHYLISENEW